MKPKNLSTQNPLKEERNTIRGKGKLLFHPAYPKNFSDSSKTNTREKSQKRRKDSSAKKEELSTPEEYSKIRIKEDYIYMIQSLLF
ncbi:hypothetical protein EHQ12_17570 [Leptospira gomenensis]|uniref:Uncharacterized protein n=1 Tax=Leptospira gomenensis TaxID=2484974 RepID=A0A5F1Y729_9LEPT|nr:hypothetical protein [Leptospira gomenensis]TGK29435.1 hypothetical protein EHQ17_15765 [Leptospira gomenensis]TGK33662.1 hypothetical protein EHQ12_17570 [Leptospira gomenensis]TGK44903.1 hypothetical protein EHQ07_11525 [Leptospira gomenensis]TGK64524.1 hypothetical protein EHQ13_07610 [Leptospira gomenensis]